jgi:hypothetical protein
LQTITIDRYSRELALDPDELLLVLKQADDLIPDVTRPALRARSFTLAEVGRVREASTLIDSISAIPAVSAAMPPLYWIRTIMGVAGLYPADSLLAQPGFLPRTNTSTTASVARLVHLARGDIAAADAVPVPPLQPDTAPGPNLELGMRTALDAYALMLRGIPSVR